MLEAQLLSKIIDEDKYFELARYNVGPKDFPTLAPVYQFLSDYVRENGKAPDYRTVSAHFEAFDYYPEVADGYKYLCTQLKAQSAKRAAFELLQKQAPEQFKKLGGDKFATWLRTEAEKIERQTALLHSLGMNYATNGEERRLWYEDARDKRSFQYIPTPYGSLTKALGGGFELGDYILLLAYTNRGKSWISSDIGRIAWKSGFGVLHYSPELSKRQQAARIDTLEGHYDNQKLRRGTLANENDYFAYLNRFTAANEQPPYIIKTMEDLPDGLSLDVIEADMQMNDNIGLVIIDGFNLMNHKGGGRSGRDSMTYTSRQLRQIFGKYGVAGLVVHQTPTAAEKDKGKDEDGARLVSPPKLADAYSETVAVIQDAATVLTFDQAEGIGKISVEKAREPSVGTLIELSCNFNLGYVREQDITYHF